MKISVNPQIFLQQDFGGISRYYTEIFSQLASQKLATVQVPIYACNNVYFNQSSLLTAAQKNVNTWNTVLTKIGISQRSKIRKRNLKYEADALNSLDFDLYIPTYYDTKFINRISSKPFVLTVYDMIHELYPIFFDDAAVIAKNKLTLMQGASKIIAVSQSTKNDILKIYPKIDASKIEVIYHGNSIKINENVVVNLPENYILFVGSRDNYKNFKFLITSITSILRNNLSLKVVCAGGGKFTNEEIQFLENLGLQNQVLQQNFKESELGQFYKKAKCFVFPSSYEGFGIPVLEAMACSCPIVLTNYSSFPEVAGDAGVYFELNNADDLKNKIQSLLENEPLRHDYIAKGLEQIKKFSWETAANQCFDVYKEALVQNKI